MMSDEKPEDSRPPGTGESPSGGSAQEVGVPADEVAGEAGPPEGAQPDDSREGEAAGGPEAAPEAEAAAEAGACAAAEDAARALEEALRDAEVHREMALRTRAELENVRRRAERDVANAHRYGLERFVSELLPVRDSLELGVSAAADDADVARVREGMELTLKLMASAFDKAGLEVVDPAGEPFDPELHQAMSMQEGEEGQSGTVLNVIQKGYRLHDRLVRPALVVVAK